MWLLNAGWRGKQEGGRLGGGEEEEKYGSWQQEEGTWVGLVGSKDDMKIWVLLLI